MVVSTRSNAVHIRAIQQDTLSFLQISYPWLQAEDIFQNVDETATLLQQIKDLNISQAAQADTMIEELFLEWDEFPPLSEDDYSQANPKHGGWKNDPSPLTYPAHCTSHPPSSRVSTHRAPLKKKYGVKQVRHSVTVISATVLIVTALAEVTAIQQSLIIPPLY